METKKVGRYWEILEKGKLIIRMLEEPSSQKIEEIKKGLVASRKIIKDSESIAVESAQKIKEDEKEYQKDREAYTKDPEKYMIGQEKK